jgi:ABC-type antimicrobial peptide transport system permease subunit
MLQRNLLLLYRSFKCYKSTFFINLIGLSSGLACAFLIYLWIIDELSVDKFHEKDSQLFQVMTKTDSGGEIKVGDSSPFPLAEALVEEMSDVQYAVTVRSWKNKQGIISVADSYVKATEQYVGKDFFNIFSYNLIQGEKDHVLRDKNSVLLSDELAKKLFNTTENIIGKSIEWNQEELSGIYFISGIFNAPPSKSTIQFDLIFPFELYREKRPQINAWANGGATTFVVLKKGADVSRFNEGIKNFLQKKNNVSTWSIFLRPFSEGYLYDKYINGVQAGGRIEYVKLFSLVGVFILIIACINFMNLSTAKASRKIKEIGIKKAIGATRKALVFQYMSESILMAFLSLAVSVLLVGLLLPRFNETSGKHLRLDFDLNSILPFLVIALATGLVSGSYPALYLSGFKPVVALRGKLSTSLNELWARKGLVIFQFCVSVILIVSVVVVYKQVGLLQSKPLGYSKDNVVLFKKEGKLVGDIETFLHEVKSVPGVVNASHIEGDMTRASNITSDLSWEGKKPDEIIDFGEMHINYDLIETLGIEIKEGRSFSRDFITDNSKIIFNEAAIAAMGLTEPIGKTIKLWGEDKQIVGVVKNFHFESLYEHMKPCFMHITPYANNVVVKIRSGTERETIGQLEKIYQSHNLGLPFDFKFLDEGYQKLYVSENRIAVLSWYFAGIAILISCLGLFGLAAFTVERRLKEIGIRKILGASDFGMMSLLSNDFMKMVSASIVLGLPISYLVARNWLDDFAYRINLEWWVFIGAAIISLSIAWLTVASQTLKAARINPGNHLRTE